VRNRHQTPLGRNSGKLARRSLQWMYSSQRDVIVCFVCFRFNKLQFIWISWISFFIDIPSSI
jgi:hypothetical protein